MCTYLVSKPLKILFVFINRNSLFVKVLHIFHIADLFSCTEQITMNSFVFRYPCSHRHLYPYSITPVLYSILILGTFTKMDPVLHIAS